MSSEPRDQYLAVCDELQRVVAERDALAALLNRVLSCTDLHGWNGATAELLCADIDAALAGDKP